MKRLIISILFIIGQIAMTQAQECVLVEHYYNERYYVWDHGDDTYSITSESDYGWELENLQYYEAESFILTIRRQYNIWMLPENTVMIQGEEGLLIYRELSGEILGKFIYDYGFKPNLE